MGTLERKQVFLPCANSLRLSQQNADIGVAYPWTPATSTGGRQSQVGSDLSSMSHTRASLGDGNIKLALFEHVWPEDFFGFVCVWPIL